MYINVTIAGNIHIIKRMRNCTCFIILCSFSHRANAFVKHNCVSDGRKRKNAQTSYDCALGSSLWRSKMFFLAFEKKTFNDINHCQPDVILFVCVFVLLLSVPVPM